MILSHKPSALFVDSETQVLRALKRTLRELRHDWDLFFFESAAQAQARISEIQPWIVVADVHALKTDQALVQALNRHAPAALRVMVTAYADESAVLYSAKYAHFLLSKPYEAERLFQLFETTKTLHHLNMSDELRSCLGTLRGLPVLPDYYHRIAHELGKPEPSVEAVAQIIQNQSTVLARLLQIANSVFFGYTSAAVTAQEVVMRLGLDMVKNLVLFSGLFTVDDDLEDERSLAQIAKEAMTVFELAGRLADELEIAPSMRGKLLLAGLVHNIGKLVNLRCCCAQSGRMADLNEEYEVAGAFLLCLWGFEPALVEAVKRQNDPSLPSKAGPVERMLNAAVLLSDSAGIATEESLALRYRDPELIAAVMRLGA